MSQALAAAGAVALTVLFWAATAAAQPSPAHGIDVRVAAECLPDGWSVDAVEHQLRIELADAARDPALPPPPALRLRAAACGDAEHFVLETLDDAPVQREIALDDVAPTLRVRALAMITADIARAVLRGEPLTQPAAPGPGDATDATDEDTDETTAPEAPPAEPSARLAAPRPPAPPEPAAALGSPQGPAAREPGRFALSASLPISLLAGPTLAGGAALEARWIVPDDVTAIVEVTPRYLRAEASSSLGTVSLDTFDVAVGVALTARAGPWLLGGGAGLAVGYVHLEGHPIDGRAIGHANDSTLVALPLWVELDLRLDPFFLSLRGGADVALVAMRATVLGDIVLSRAPLEGSVLLALGFSLPM